jgi:hypothetical protein
MSTPPSSSTARATSALTDSSSPVSVTTGIARLPLRSATSAAAFSSVSWVRAASTTSTPSAARACAIASPMPLLPPVMIARLPVSCRSTSILLVLLGFGVSPQGPRQAQVVAQRGARVLAPEQSAILQ